jgi:PEP-CTERM motif
MCGRVSAMACIICLTLSAHRYALAGKITFQVVDDKGSNTIPNGHYEKIFGSRMTADLGAEWGSSAGHYERNNSEKLIWVNDGPPIVIKFANVFPQEIHVPEDPAPNVFHGLYHIDSFFDVFTELHADGGLSPLEPGMQIEEGPDTFLEGSSGTKYPGKVTPINDLNLLPTSTDNGTQIVWDLSRFPSTSGNYYLIEYDLPPIELVDVPEPTTLIGGTLALGVVGLVITRRRCCCR